ncbi:hypothetical protein HAP94_17000 [Acidithiobacillus ferrivorans]|nr:hypothetical protein [Acidithiobacillus ferrivorans]
MTEQQDTLSAIMAAMLPDLPRPVVEDLRIHYAAAARLERAVAELLHDPAIQADPDSFAMVKKWEQDSRLVFSQENLARLAGSNKGRSNNAKRKDRGQPMVELKAFALQLYHQGPFGGGKWKSNSHAAKSIFTTVNAKADELKVRNVSEGTIRNWIGAQRRLPATGRMQE